MITLSDYTYRNQRIVTYLCTKLTLMQQIVAILMLSCRQVLDITEPSYILKEQYTTCEI